MSDGTRKLCLDKGRKLSAEFASLRRQTPTYGKYKKKLDKQDDGGQVEQLFTFVTHSVIHLYICTMRQKTES